MRLQVDSLSMSQRREKIKSALHVTRTIPNGRPHAEALQGELIRREAALVTASAENERLRENVSEQLASKRVLREELQVPSSMSHGNLGPLTPWIPSCKESRLCDMSHQRTTGNEARGCPERRMAINLLQLSATLTAHAVNANQSSLQPRRPQINYSTRHYTLPHSRSAQGSPHLKAPQGLISVLS